MTQAVLGMQEWVGDWQLKQEGKKGRTHHGKINVQARDSREAHEEAAKKVAREIFHSRDPDLIERIRISNIHAVRRTAS